MAEEKTRDGWDRADAAASIASKLLIPVILVVATSLLSRGLQERQTRVSEGGLDRQWVELALGVLQDKDMSNEEDIRSWSVAVINHYMPAEIQLPDKLREGLVDGTVTLPASTPWSISGPEVTRIQNALNQGLLCQEERLFADGLAGFSTRWCLSRFLGGAPDNEVQGLLSRAPALLAGWVEGGAPPPNWRELAGAALLAPPVVAVMPPDYRPHSVIRREQEARSAAAGTEQPAGAPPAVETAGSPRPQGPVARIQTAMADRGLCDTTPDGALGMATLACVAGYLGDGSVEEARSLVTEAPDLLLGWIEAGPPPPDWRAQADAR